MDIVTGKSILTILKNESFVIKIIDTIIAIVNAITKPAVNVIKNDPKRTTLKSSMEERIVALGTTIWPASFSKSDVK